MEKLGELIKAFEAACLPAKAKPNKRVDGYTGVLRHQHGIIPGMELSEAEMREKEYARQALIDLFDQMTGDVNNATITKK